MLVVEVLHLAKFQFRLGGVSLCLLPVLFLLSQERAKTEDAVLVKEGESIVLRSGEHEVPVTSDRILWAPNGKRLAVYSEPAGDLMSFTVATGTHKLVSGGAATPLWSPDAAKLAYWKEGDGLKVFLASAPSEPPITLATDAVAGVASWSPDGGRMVFGTLNDIWIIDAFGQERRRVLRNRTAAAVGWSSDGKWLAILERPLKTAAGSLLLVRPSGTGLRRVGALDASQITFSPNGRYLLAKTSSGWSAVETETAKTRPLPIPASSDPLWVGGQKLMYAEGARVKSFAMEAVESRTLRSRTEPKEVLAWAPTPFFEITNDVTSADPFKNLKRPVRGQLRISGYIESLDPMDGRLTLQVESVIDGNGKTTYLPRPVPQNLTVPDSAILNSGSANTALRSVDLRLDAEASVLIQADELNSSRTYAIQECAIAGMDALEVRPLGAGPRLSSPQLDYDGASREHIIVPLVFPVLGGARYDDWFLKPRGGGKRRHQGQDLMAPKMTPLVACFDGTVRLGRSRGNAGNTITIYGDNGWIAQYYHVNNDTPGTNDGMGGDEYAFAPGLNSGDRVYAGQFVGYLGNSGNAESTAPHLHFELWDSVTRGFINAYHSLRSAQGISEPIAKKQAPEIVPPKGETRFDGIVQEVDLTRKVVRAKLLSRTENGKTKTITKMMSVYGKVGPKADIHLLGNDNLPLKLEDLRPGLYAVIIGPTPKPGAAVDVNRAAFAPQ